jgi:hypothetical protein
VTILDKVLYGFIILVVVVGVAGIIREVLK